MQDDWSQWSHHVRKELERLSDSAETLHDSFSTGLARVEQKMDTHGEILLRNTLSLEDHVKRTNLLQDKVIHVETEVEGLTLHVHKVRWLTSTAMQFLVVLGGLVAIAGTFLSIYTTLAKK